ncbi:MAG: DUF47 domain-containing protein [Myxococcota bacterium]
MLKKLLPKEIDFFEYFDKIATTIDRGLELFEKTVKNYNNCDFNVCNSELKEIEHEADTLVHLTIEALNKTFLTPIDREDIQSLVKKIDDILDLTQATMLRFDMYKIKSITPEFISLTEVLRLSFVELHKAVLEMRDFKNREKIQKHCIEINRLENEGDSRLRNAITKLFAEEQDPINIIKWKEIYENIEMAIDRCEDVANVIEGIVLKNA